MTSGTVNEKAERSHASNTGPVETGQLVTEKLLGDNIAQKKADERGEGLRGDGEAVETGIVGAPYREEDVGRVVSGSTARGAIIATAAMTPTPTRGGGTRVGAAKGGTRPKGKEIGNSGERRKGAKGAAVGTGESQRGGWLQADGSTGRGR